MAIHNIPKHAIRNIFYDNLSILRWKDIDSTDKKYKYFYHIFELDLSFLSLLFEISNLFF